MIIYTVYTPTLYTFLKSVEKRKFETYIENDLGFGDDADLAEQRTDEFLSHGGVQVADVTKFFELLRFFFLFPK